MSIRVLEVDYDMLPIYAELPLSFKVESVFQVSSIDLGLGGICFAEQKTTPYMKYTEQNTDQPERWPERFGEDNLGLLMAFRGSRPVGGAALIVGLQPGMSTPFDREGVAALWDIRVHPDERRNGIGSSVLRKSACWAREKGCTYMRIETSSANVPACKFYARNGCKLVAIHRQGYSSTKVSDESMLIWHLDL